MNGPCCVVFVAAATRKLNWYLRNRPSSRTRVSGRVSGFVRVVLRHNFKMLMPDRYVTVIERAAGEAASQKPLELLYYETAT